jgi:hypothetical protein
MIVQIYRRDSFEPENTDGRWNVIYRPVLGVAASSLSMLDTYSVVMH